MGQSRSFDAYFCLFVVVLKTQSARGKSDDKPNHNPDDRQSDVYDNLKLKSNYKRTQLLIFHEWGQGGCKENNRLKAAIMEFQMVLAD